MTERTSEPGDRSGAEVDGRTTIGELIIAERRNSGASYRDLATRAEHAGFPVKFQYLNELVRSGPKGWPKNPDTFRALAAILKLPVRSIVLAYAASLGLEVENPGSKLAEQLPDNTRDLSEEMTQALLHVIRAAGT